MIEIENILDVTKYIEHYDVIIFDLDDTLYSEKEYVRSGYEAIGKAYPKVTNFSKELWEAFLNDKKAIDEVLSLHNMFSEKDKCLSIYRNHQPNIHLYPGIRKMLDNIRIYKKIAMVTDGRPSGQKAKIEALNIESYFDKIIITDELGGISFRKPNEIAFVIMKEYFNVPYENMCYVGDNINKDGIAPEKLGMGFIHFNNKEGLYK